MAKTQTITAAVLAGPGGTWELRELEHTLKAFQAVVGGPVELVGLEDGAAIFYCHEEGKILGLPPRRAWVDPGTGEVLDVLLGDLLAFGGLDDEGWEKPASPETIRILERHLRPVRPA